jgi:hypothetical protein
MNTTLNAIRAHEPCEDGWKKLLRHLGKTRADDEPLPLRVILDSNGLDDALWCLRAVPDCDREARLYAVWCARQVQHLMTDPRSIAALNVAERHAKGLATDDELAAAADAAGAAALSAAADAAWAAAWEAAGTAAWAAALDAAGAAARSVAGLRRRMRRGLRRGMPSARNLSRCFAERRRSDDPRRHTAHGATGWNAGSADRCVNYARRD